MVLHKFNIRTIYPSYSNNGLARQHGWHRQAKQELHRSSSTSTRWVGAPWMWTVEPDAGCYFCLTIFCLQPWRLLPPPVRLRMTGASPPTGSLSRSISWERCSPLMRAGERSKKCLLLVLQWMMTTRRVSADGRSFCFEEPGHGADL